MSGSLEQKKFEEIIFSDKVTLKNEEKQFNSEEDGDRVLLEFTTPPYELLMDKIRKLVDLEQTETKNTLLYLKYKDSGDTWELGYIELDLNFWKFLDDIFTNYNPTLYKIHADRLEKLSKLDYIGTVKFGGSALDGFIE